MESTGMASTSRENDILANPFYLTLMAVSTLFVVTSLGYLVTPYVLGAGQTPQGETSRAWAAWLDRNGPMILGLEFAVMLVAGVLAMVTDDWFSNAHKRNVPPQREQP